MFDALARKLFGTANERYVKRLQPIVESVNALEAHVSQLSDAELAQRTTQLKERVAKGTSLDDVLPDAFAMEVVMRMLRMETVQKDVLDGVEKTLRAEFMSNLARSARRDAHELMADIFNNLDRQAESRFLNGLEERNRDAAERIKSLMFTFDDLQRLSGQSVQVLLRTVEKDKLPVALKGASEKIRELFLSNLSERAAKMLRDEMEGLGPVKVRDVDEAQSSIVLLAKELEIGRAHV